LPGLEEVLNVRVENELGQRAERGERHGINQALAKAVEEPLGKDTDVKVLQSAVVAGGGRPTDDGPESSTEGGGGRLHVGGWLVVEDWVVDWVAILVSVFPGTFGWNTRSVGKNPILNGRPTVEHDVPVLDESFRCVFHLGVSVGVHETPMKNQFYSRQSAQSSQTYFKLPKRESSTKHSQ
jgi:hypothetical protein